MKVLLCSRYFCSKYVETLYQRSKATQTPFFTINSLACRIIEDPLDFYAVLTNSISNASQRIGLSCLYLSTGPLQRHILAKMAQRHKMCPQLESALVFDFYRSQRQEAGQSPMQMINNWKEQVGSQATVAYQKISQGRGVLGQILGVHHQKIYLFDNRVVLSGANLSKNYFLNRRDRALLIDSPELANYLFQYLQILADDPKQEDLLTHYRLWKYSHMPPKYCSTFRQQLQFLKTLQAERHAEFSRSFSWQKNDKNVVLSRNQTLARQIGTSLTPYKPLPAKQFRQKRERVRQNLFGVKSEDYVGNQIEEVEEKGFWNAPIQAGKQVYLFPFIQWAKLQESQEYNVFTNILRLAAEQNHSIKMTSGYLNLDQKLLKSISEISKLERPVELLCSSPQANSFYRAKGLRGLVPYMYRCYELSLLKELGSKVQIKQFFNGQWSYHAKGVWIQQAENSMVSIIGSSNYNERSRYRDSQFQFYLYSGCEDFNGRLKQEWKQLEKNCQTITQSAIENDDDIKINAFHRLMATISSSIL